MPQEDDWDEADEAPARRQAARSKRRALMIAGVVALLTVPGLVVLVVLFVVFYHDRERAKPNQEVVAAPPAQLLPQATSPESTPAPAAPPAAAAPTPAPRDEEPGPASPAPKKPATKSRSGTSSRSAGKAPAAQGPQVILVVPVPVLPPAKPVPVAVTVPDDPVVVFPHSEPRPKKEFPAGYYTRQIKGFTVLISKLAYEESDKYGGRPLGYLEAEFARTAELFDKKTLAVLAKVPVWVEWDHTVPDVGAFGTVLGVYYGGVGEALQFEGIDPRKNRSVCLLSLKAAYSFRARGLTRKLVILHELAHAVHDQIFGFQNTFVENAYEQAMTRGLYKNVRHVDKTTRTAYAASSKHEYFAELTCAYLDEVNYSPKNSDELREYDSVGYELMTKAWGSPEQIEARKAKDKPAKKSTGSKAPDPAGK